MDATWTITLHLWWLWAYLAIGAVLYVPFYYLAWRGLARPKPSPFAWWREGFQRRWWRKALTEPLFLLLWPVALWEELR